MVVVHHEQQQDDARDSAECRGRQRPLIHRDAKYLEDGVAEGDVDEAE